MAVTANRIDAALVIGFIRHTFSLPLSYFDARHVGDIISRVQENNKIQKTYRGQLVKIRLQVISSAIETISNTTLIWIGASLVISGEFTIGQLFAFLVSRLVITPIRALAVILVVDSDANLLDLAPTSPCYFH